MAHSKLIKKKATNKTKKKQQPITPQEKFQHFWATIEKYQRQLVKLQQDQEALFARFQQDVLPLEHQYIQSVFDKTERLLSFADKKSLSKNQRETLFEWIEEELSRLQSYPFNSQLDMTPLVDRFISVTSQYTPPPSNEDIAQFREALDTKFDFSYAFSDDEISEMIRNPDKLQAALEQLSQEWHSRNQQDSAFDAEEDDDDWQESEYAETDGEESKRTAASTDGNLLDTKHITLLYRRIAKALHPDREQDPAEKEKKHHLMTMLSKAKQEHDIWTLLTLYHQYVDASFAFDESTIPSINTLLESRVNTLKNALADQKHDPSLPGMVWQEMGAATAKTREKKIAEHQRYLRESTAIELAQTQSLRSLAVLKQYLAERNEDDNMDFLMDLFDQDYRF
ncbi:hypothetical protein QM999_13500 [Pectobacterium cacticida]|uniref:hypothetical protein n=1 Tax=Pectobacterium cacticida TaxID=69221 RepID=UPI002FF26887